MVWQGELPTEQDVKELLEEIKKDRQLKERSEEEPKGTYFINTQGDVQFWDSSSFAYPDDWTKEKQIGNYFETREEAEKAIERLRAWKRLKDKGFRFDGWEDLQAKIGIDDLMLFSRDVINTDNVIGFRMDDYHDCIKDLDICFGGEK